MINMAALDDTNTDISNTDFVGSQYVDGYPSVYNYYVSEINQTERPIFATAVQAPKYLELAFQSAKMHM